MSTHIEKLEEQMDDYNGLVYIVNITVTIIGKSVIDDLKSKGFGPNGKKLYQALLTILATKVSSMNSETLGKICSFGTLHGVHQDGYDCRCNPPQFINQSGINDVCDFVFKARTLAVGRQALEELSTMVLVSFARDIILQDNWLKAWNEADKEHMEEVIHGHDWKYGL